MCLGTSAHTGRFPTGRPGRGLQVGLVKYGRCRGYQQKGKLKKIHQYPLAKLDSVTAFRDLWENGEVDSVLLGDS